MKSLIILVTGAVAASIIMFEGYPNIVWGIVGTAVIYISVIYIAMLCGAGGK